MKQILLLMALSAFTLPAVAQTTEDIEPAPLETILKLELGLQGGGLGYELPLGNKWSVNLSAGLGGGHYIEKSSYANGFHSSWIINDPAAYLKSELRYTYNRAKRLSKSKSLLHNAGNYVAFQTKYTTRRVFGSNAWENAYEPLNRSLLNEVHWGIQRPLGQRFIFNTHLGLGYAVDFDFNNSQVYPAAEVRFAYTLSKSNKF